jgi:predicted site-specific integrase-resolvase
MARSLTTREIADLLGVETWRVRRLYEDGDLPEPARFAGKRVIPSSDIPAVVDALRRRRWLLEEASIHA